jgi:hypothetical protein
MTAVPLSTDPAPQEKIDRVIAEITAQREHDLRAARKVRRWISWAALSVIILAAVSFILSIVATKFGIPSRCHWLGRISPTSSWTSPKPRMGHTVRLAVEAAQL